MANNAGKEVWLGLGEIGQVKVCPTEDHGQVFMDELGVYLIGRKAEALMIILSKVDYKSWRLLREGLLKTGTVRVRHISNLICAIMCHHVLPCATYDTTHWSKDGPCVPLVMNGAR